MTVGIPDTLTETIRIEVAHFEPTPITITGEGVFPLVALTLPRVENDAFATALATAKDRLKSQPVSEHRWVCSVAPVAYVLARKANSGVDCHGDPSLKNDSLPRHAGLPLFPLVHEQWVYLHHSVAVRVFPQAFICAAR